MLADAREKKNRPKTCHVVDALLVKRMYRSKQELGGSFMLLFMFHVCLLICDGGIKCPYIITARLKSCSGCCLLKHFVPYAYTCQVVSCVVGSHHSRIPTFILLICPNAFFSFVIGSTHLGIIEKREVTNMVNASEICK